MPDPDQNAIAITRPVGKGRDTAELVKSLGWTPFIFHTVQLKPLDNREITDQIRSHMIGGGRVDWLVFMSSSGVKPLLNNLDSETRARENLRRTRFLAVGPRTKETLGDLGIEQVEIPERYSSDGVDDFFSKLNPENLRIILVRSSSAEDSLSKSLVSKGASVDTINVYGSEMPDDLESAFRFLEHLSARDFSAVLFTSAISASNLFKIAATRFEEKQVVRWLKTARTGAIGPVTAEELQRRGLEPIVPDEYLIENAVRRLVVPSSSIQV
jgi:uroporphyrinogen-III synthase